MIGEIVCHRCAYAPRNSETTSLPVRCCVIDARRNGIWQLAASMSRRCWNMDSGCQSRRMSREAASVLANACTRALTTCQTPERKTVAMLATFALNLMSCASMGNPNNLALFKRGSEKHCHGDLVVLGSACCTLLQLSALNGASWALQGDNRPH